jgi:hypothetical protein
MSQDPQLVRTPGNRNAFRARARTAGIAALALSSCAAAGAVASGGLIGLDILRKTFDGVAAKNYGEQYKDNADDLFKALSKPAGEKVAGSPASGSPASSALPAPETPPAPASGTATAAGASPAAAALTDAAPLTLEVGIFKETIVEGKSMPVPVQDGEILYDGYGSHGAGDAIKFMFRANVDAWVYVISIDATGWIQPIFPSGYSGSTNPVKANQTYLFPEGSTWAPLDSYRGVEHLYFMAGRSRRPDLERSLAAFAARARDADPKRGAVDGPPALAQVSSDAQVMRGFDAPRKSVAQQVPSSGGESFAVDSQLFVSNSPGDILITRWFHHQ